MSEGFRRRWVLQGLLASAATPAVAGAPSRAPRPVPRNGTPPAKPAAYSGLISKAGLGGDLTFAVADAESGQILEVHNPEVRLPPASVAKAATAFYGLEQLGPGFQFETRLVAGGPVVNGRLDGDLILVGDGDPTLDSDNFGEMVTGLKELGIHEVTGKLRIKADMFPSLPWIDPNQPQQVAYNPAISGLNLNFNRVHFEWTKKNDSYDITMQARALRYRPAVSVATMELADRRSPVYTYDRVGGLDKWTVASRALGRDGARWLPISQPADYAADAFLTIARSHGIVLARGPDVFGPVAGETLVSYKSAPLREMLTGMLKYSTNLTAEAVGLRAAIEAGVRPGSLIRSAREMNHWLRREAGTHSTGFTDHSGLGYGSRVSSTDMVRILQAARARGNTLKDIMKEFRTDGVADVRAKTGTLNFVSGLAGYVQASTGRELIFAIFSGDLERRDAIEITHRERPPGARGWASRARVLQKDLIARWSSLTV